MKCDRGGPGRITEPSKVVWNDHNDDDDDDDECEDGRLSGQLASRCRPSSVSVAAGPASLTQSRRRTRQTAKASASLRRRRSVTNMGAADTADAVGPRTACMIFLGERKGGGICFSCVRGTALRPCHAPQPLCRCYSRTGVQDASILMHRRD